MDKYQEALERVVAASLSVAAGRAHRDLSEPRPWDDADEEYRVDELKAAVRAAALLDTNWEDLRS